MFLLTPAVDPRYQLGLFPANLKQKVVRLLKPEVDIHSCRETGQSGQVSLVPPNKLNYLKLMIPKYFLFSLQLNQKQVQTLTQVTNKIQLIKRLRHRLRFFGWRNSAEKVKEAKVMSWWKSNKKKYTNFSRFARRYLSAQLSSVYSEKLFSEAGNLYKQKRNWLFWKMAKDFYFFILIR